MTCARFLVVFINESTTSVTLEHLICYFVVGFFVWMGLFIWQSLEKSKRDSHGKYD